MQLFRPIRFIPINFMAGTCQEYSFSILPVVSRKSENEDKWLEKSRELAHPYISSFWKQIMELSSSLCIYIWNHIMQTVKVSKIHSLSIYSVSGKCQNSTPYISISNPVWGDTLRYNGVYMHGHGVKIPINKF